MDQHASGWAKRSQFTGHRGAVYALAPLNGAHAFLSTGGDGKVVRWDLRTPDAGEQVADALMAVFAMHYDADSGRLFLGNEAGGLHVIDLREREELRSLQAHKRGIFRILPIGGQRLACTGGDGCLTVWSLPGMEQERRIPLSEEKLRGMAVSPDGTLLAVAGLDGRVRILETAELNELHTLEGHDRGAASLCWHPAKPVLISGGRDGHLRFWRTDRGFAPLHAFPAHRANIYAIAFDPLGRLCATASRDKSVKLWDAASFDPVDRFEMKAKGHTHSVNDLLWMRDGDVLLSAGDDRTIRAWGRVQNG